MSSSIRRTHTKSRKGCQTCKDRKVRCDEYFPQWSAFSLFDFLYLFLIASISRNCTKRGLRCAYMDNTAAAESTSPASTIGEFTWPTAIEVGTHDWQQTKTFPFPHLQLTAPPNPDDLSTEECRLLFHICTLSKNLELNQSARFTTWAHKMPEYVRYPLLMLTANWGVTVISHNDCQLCKTRYNIRLSNAVIDCTLGYPSRQYLQIRCFGPSSIRSPRQCVQKP